MTKVVGIDSGKKSPTSCPYCGAKKACPDFTCPRIAKVWSCGDEWQIDFWESWNNPPPDGDEAA